MKTLFGGEHFANVLNHLLFRLGIGVLALGAYAVFVDRAMFFYG